MTRQQKAMPPGAPPRNPAGTSTHFAPSREVPLAEAPATSHPKVETYLKEAGP